MQKNHGGTAVSPRLPPGDKTSENNVIYAQPPYMLEINTPMNKAGTASGRIGSTARASAIEIEQYKT